MLINGLSIAARNLMEICLYSSLFENDFTIFIANWFWLLLHRSLYVDVTFSWHWRVIVFMNTCAFKPAGVVVNLGPWTRATQEVIWKSTNVPFQVCCNFKTPACCLCTNEQQLLYKCIIRMSFAIFLRETVFCCYIIRTPLCLPCPPLPSKNTFCSLCVRLISSMETTLSIHTTLTLCYNRRSSHLVYRYLILSQAHLGKVQTIYPFIQLQSEAEQIPEKSLSSGRITDYTIMIAKKWPWHYQKH